MLIYLRKFNDGRGFKDDDLYKEIKYNYETWKKFNPVIQKIFKRKLYFNISWGNYSQNPLTQKIISNNNIYIYLYLFENNKINRKLYQEVFELINYFKKNYR